ncbi:MAG: hypothetical protein DMG24_20125 [Acidobacteria bacterium]|nr:MAG: hypothetical protein DMG24_20125 [Acidobacteriota bacterium]
MANPRFTHQPNQLWLLLLVLEAAAKASHGTNRTPRAAHAGSHGWWVSQPWAFSRFHEPTVNSQTESTVATTPTGGPLVACLLLLGLLVTNLTPAADEGLQAPAARLPQSCEQTGATSGQVSALLQTLSTHPSAEGYNTLGALYAQRKQLDCAIAAFDQALQLDSGSWDARYNLGLALISRQDYTRAVRELQAAVKTKPESFAARNALGVAYRSLGQLDAAVKEFKEALRLNPRFADASLNLADATLDQKRYAAAIYYLEQALANSPPPPFAERLQTDLAVAYSENGDYDRAAEVFKKLIALHPNSAKLHFNLATPRPSTSEPCASTRPMTARACRSPKRFSSSTRWARACPISAITSTTGRATPRATSSRDRPIASWGASARR